MKDDIPVLEVAELGIRKSGKQIVDSLSFRLLRGDHLAITGVAGSGKTLLAQALAGRLFHSGTIDYFTNTGTIALIEQQHHFRNRSNTSSFYYQQRFNSFDADDALTVQEYLGTDEIQLPPILKGQTELLKKPLIQLSNGENKKVQLALAMMQKPEVFVMDQPFVGLDTATRKFLHDQINELSKTGCLIILVTQPGDLPECFNYVLELSPDTGALFQSRYEYDLKEHGPISRPHKFDDALLHQLIKPPATDRDSTIVEMKQVQVKLGEKIILSGIDWEIKSGEMWLLTGPNGAGKSTLLSLITADNPQAYANHIYLFGRKRGTGETIWEIKQKIGYLSPELHLYFDNTCTCFEAVASGLFDTIGLFRQMSEEQSQLVLDWMSLTGIRSLANKNLFTVSQGEQRKVLLTRALIKNPPLLILDEPCQGLDDETEADLLELINNICVLGKKSLIYVTHNADRIPAGVNRYLTLENGRVKGER